MGFGLGFRRLSCLGILDSRLRGNDGGRGAGEGICWLGFKVDFRRLSCLGGFWIPAFAGMTGAGAREIGICWLGFKVDFRRLSCWAALDSRFRGNDGGRGAERGFIAAAPRRLFAFRAQLAESLYQFAPLSGQASGQYGADYGV